MYHSVCDIMYVIFYVFEAFHLMAIPAPDSITVVTSYLLLCAQHHQNNLQISKPLGLSTCFQVNHKAEHFFLHSFPLM